jgi:hypothetical protein
MSKSEEFEAVQLAQISTNKAKHEKISWKFDGKTYKNNKTLGLSVIDSIYSFQCPFMTLKEIARKIHLVELQIYAQRTNDRDFINYAYKYARTIYKKDDRKRAKIEVAYLFDITNIIPKTKKFKKKTYYRSKPKMNYVRMSKLKKFWFDKTAKSTLNELSELERRAKSNAKYLSGICSKSILRKSINYAQNEHNMVKRLKETRWYRGVALKDKSGKMPEQIAKYKPYTQIIQDVNQIIDRISKVRPGSHKCSGKEVKKFDELK